MKKTVNGIIVVEGKSDIAFLSQFIDAEFVPTNGSEIPAKTIEYLKKAQEKRSIFVLTDPDFPGKRIRDVLDENIPNLKHCFVSKEKSIKKNKVGVAESSKEEVLSALAQYISVNKDDAGSLTENDLLKLGLIGSESSKIKREIVCEKYHLGFCNAKTFLKRINYAKLSLSDLEIDQWMKNNTSKI